MLSGTGAPTLGLHRAQGEAGGAQLVPAQYQGFRGDLTLQSPNNLHYPRTKRNILQVLEPDGLQLAFACFGGGRVADATLEVMTVGEVAEYLRIPTSSVYKLAQNDRIPCRKAGRQWRFFRQAIDEWLSKRGPAGREGGSGTQGAM